MAFFMLSLQESKALFFSLLCSFLLLGLTEFADAEQEGFVMLNTFNDLSPTILQSLSHSNVPVAVSVSNEDLYQISSSVLTAESWVRTHVLTHFPAIKITTIVAGTNVLCNGDNEDKWDLVLPSLQNIYHSLIRWGLEKDIKMSAAFSQDCLDPFSPKFRDDLVDKVIQNLLNFLQNSNSTYSANPQTNHFSPDLVYALTNSIRNLGFSKLSNEIVTVVISSPATSPSPLAPTTATAPQASMPLFVFAPDASPAKAPSSPAPQSPNFPPPCLPSPVALSPGGGSTRGGEKKMWCVAKPSVPAATLQAAMDYACGAGGGDCDEIKPHGRCYNPDTVVAHASYAFNSYWQKNKKKGATCSFGGTAMIISSDPSFLHCRFVVDDDDEQY